MSVPAPLVPRTPRLTAYSTQISYNAKFIAQGCKAPSAQPGVTFGVCPPSPQTSTELIELIYQAGNYFDQLYQFAEQNNLTIVGGSDRTVGAAGGWVQVGANLPSQRSSTDRVLGWRAWRPLQHTRSRSRSCCEFYRPECVYCCSADRGPLH